MQDILLAEVETTKELSKQLIAVATGAIVLSVAVLTDLFPLRPEAPGYQFWLLIAAEFLWILSVVAGFIVYGSIIGLLSSARAEGKAGPIAYSPSTQYAGLAQMLTFLGGIAFFVVFVLVSGIQQPTGDSAQTTSVDINTDLELSESFAMSVRFEDAREKTDGDSCKLSFPVISMAAERDPSLGKHLIGSARSDAGGIVTVEFSDMVNVSELSPPRLVSAGPEDLSAGISDGKIVLRLREPQTEVRFRVDADDETLPISVDVTVVDECGNLAVLAPAFD